MDNIINVTIVDNAQVTVVDDKPNVEAIVTEGAKIEVEIIGTGPPGDPGVKGDPGEDGKTPVVGVDYFTEADKEEIIRQINIEGQDAYYVHDQIAAASVWYVTHNLNKHPSVTVIDTAGSVVVGDINYTDNNQLQLNFGAPFSGKAFLN